MDRGKMVRYETADAHSTGIALLFCLKRKKEIQFFIFIVKET